MRKVYQIELSKLPVREIGMPFDRWTNLETSIRLIGVLVPIIIDKQNRVWDGVHRVYMSRYIGLKTIPAIKIDSSRYGREDLERLIEELKWQVIGR